MRSPGDARLHSGFEGYGKDELEKNKNYKPTAARRKFTSNHNRAQGPALPAYSAEEQEILQRGLRILARMIVRRHLARLKAFSENSASPDPESTDDCGTQVESN